MVDAVGLLVWHTWDSAELYQHVENAACNFRNATTKLRKPTVYADEQDGIDSAQEEMNVQLKVMAGRVVYSSVTSEGYNWSYAPLASLERIGRSHSGFVRGMTWATTSERCHLGPSVLAWLHIR